MANAVNARFAKISVDSSGGTTEVNGTTNTGIQMTMSPRETSTKDDNGYRTLAPGQKALTLQIEGNNNPAAANGFKELQAFWQADTEVDWKYSNGQTGDNEYSGKGYIVDLNLGGENEQNETWSVTLEVTGAPTVTTIT